MRRLLTVVSAIAGACLVVPADALVLRKSFDVTGTNLFPAGHSTPFPANQVRGFFDIEWDTAVSVTDQSPFSGGFGWIAQSTPNMGQIVFSYDALQDRLTIGGHGKVEEALSGGWDFYLTLLNASTHRVSGGLGVQNGSRVYYAENLVVVQAVAAPEPATWAMMVAGFGLVGGALRRRSSGARASRSPARAMPPAGAGRG